MTDNLLFFDFISNSRYLIKVITYPYSESELKTLKASYNVINDAYDSLGKSMELLEIVIDTYNKFL